MGRYPIVLAGVLVATVASADSYDVARQLGAFLGSEKICKLQINYAQVQRYIREKGAGEDLDFAGELRSQAELVAYRYNEMTTAMQVAHCEQMTRAGKALELTN